MTLEDFFTLTEMKNGFTTPARVEDLISLIQNQACAKRNGGDATRQWSIVASTLASTENQDCLSHFVYLNGLCFLNQWLHEAVKYIKNVSDTEELINILLGLLEKLPVDCKKLSASGILVNIEKLLVYESTSIKLRAQTLFERWNNKSITYDGCKEIEKGCLNRVDSSKSLADAASEEDKQVADQNLDKIQCEMLVEEQSCRQESDTNLQIRSPNSNIQPDSTDKLPVESLVAAPVGMPSSSPPVCSEFPVQDVVECISSSPKNDGDIDTEMSTGIAGSNESGQRESLCALSSTSPTVSSPVKNPTLVHSASFILESTGDKLSMSEPGDTYRSCTSEGKMPMNEPTLNACKKADKKLDFELESGEFDALEVARLVAIEVEREVVDYREQSCSSSTDAISRDIASSGNHDITKNKQYHEVTGEPNENGLVACLDDSDTATSPKNDSSKFSEAVTYVKPGMQSLKSQNETTADHISSCRNLNHKCEFDLNVDAFSENLDVALYAIPSNPNSLSAPVAVSASRGSHGWAVTPLHFEGEVGWRGSASTSAFRPATNAFRPASPKRAPEFENTNPCSKLKRNRLDIDLNVADGESDLVKELPISFCIPSRGSSVEVSSGRAARMHLDLNSLGDEEAPSLQSSILSHHHQKGSVSLSPTCSSSMKPSVRNIDLNDNPIALDGISNSSITYGVRVNDPFFNVMGAEVPMERRDYTNQAHQVWMGSGFSWDTVMAGTPVLPYAPPVMASGYAYDGLGIVPAFPFPPTLYANSNIPHMGSSSTHGVPVLSTRPLLLSISSTPSSSNVVEPSNLGLDLNREADGMKHFFMPGRSNLLEEQARTASQQSTSGTPPLKRKEPDSGWEPYGFGYNQVTSWH
ncbi:hypothetical protein KSP39_PZI013315 [Platanthera zijinensis]|uniref:TFIIS N-terminal domain-containing protein n=1 Tax=Platanthera zijinensis TaxID=2320716 RepID=A0AAP0BC91_9ASPA